MRYLIPGDRCAPFPLLALLLVLSLGCGTTRALREAQGAFSDAAKADMQLRTEAQDSYAALLGLRNGGYRTTISIIDGFNAVERRELQGNELWGTALTLKALSLWRLGKYDEAERTVDAATANFADQLGPRDAAVLNALDGLIALDQADAKLEPPCTHQTVDDLVTSGLETIEAARDGLSAGEPVQRYLLQAKLAGHRTRQLAEDCEHGGRQPTYEELEAKRKDYCALEKVSTEAGVLAYWHGLLGLGTNPCP
jgi:hypothetical protein